MREFAIRINGSGPRQNPSFEVFLVPYNSGLIGGSLAVLPDFCIQVKEVYSNRDEAVEGVRRVARVLQLEIMEEEIFEDFEEESEEEEG